MYSLSLYAHFENVSVKKYLKTMDIADHVNDAPPATNQLAAVIATASEVSYWGRK